MNNLSSQAESVLAQVCGLLNTKVSQKFGRQNFEHGDILRKMREADDTNKKSSFCQVPILVDCYT